MSRSTVAPPDAYSPHTGDARIHVISTELEIACKLGGNRLDGTARLKVKARVELERFELDLVGLAVTRVNVGGKKVGFKHRDGRLSIPVPGRLKAGEKAEVEIRYGGSPGPRLGPWGDVGWEELEDGVLVAGQPDGASTWFPCNDTPGDKGRFSLCVSTDAGYRAVSNGTLVKHRRTASRETWEYEQRAPMPAYLATLQIGRYKRHEQPADDVTAVPLAVVVADPQRRRAEAAFADQPRMMACFEAAYGPYPFEAYSSLVTEDALEIPLEAQGLSVFGDNHLSGAWESQRLIAHELSHQWFGNSLTVRTWRDMWLHEGFACFSEWLWSEASGGWHLETRARHAWRGLSLAAKDLVIGDPGPRDMFDDRVYKRGALAVYALRVALGAEAFTAALHAWTAEHRHGTVSRAEFEEHLNRFAAPSVDVGSVLSPWLDQAELPAFPG